MFKKLAMRAAALLVALALTTGATFTSERVTGSTVEGEVVNGSSVTSVLNLLASVRFITDAAGALVTQTIGGVGAINFEVQALVLIEGARTSEDRVFMVQFPAGRQAGLFASNLTGFDLKTGDSQVGSVGGDIGGNPPIGEWCLLTFSADGTTGTGGFWDSSLQCLDGSPGYSHGGRTKGVEASLQGNRVDLSGAALENGWPNGIRYAEFRAYNAKRSDAQRQADITNLTDYTGALFWIRFSDNGAGGVTGTDLSGNGKTITITNGTLAVGPTL